jgi:hypothetical protein
VVCARIGQAEALLFGGLRAAQQRLAGYHARQVLLLRDRQVSEDLEVALRPAQVLGAFGFTVSLASFAAMTT